MPRIACNALALRPAGTGVQTYIRELLRALSREFVIDLLVAVQSDAVAELPVGVQTRPIRPVAGWRRALAGLRSLGPADLVHGMDVDLPWRTTAPTVTTVHDLAVFDVPWTMSRRKALGERLIYRRALRQADSVIADSAFTAERVQDLFGLSATVIHLGAPSDLGPATPEAIAHVRRRYALPEVYVLHVGTLERRKDVATVAAACLQASIPLVLAGPVQQGRVAPVSARALGYVPRQDLAALYSGAITACSSHYEGFGLPLLEAMACRGPVVAAEAGAFPEIAGDAAVLVPPGDVDRWATALAELAGDATKRAEIGEAGCQRAAAFSWTTAAAKTAAVYASLGVAVARRREGSAEVSSSTPKEVI